jgi:hypothetical protein
MSRDFKDWDGTADVPTNGHLGRQAPRTPVGGDTSSNDGPSLPRPWPTQGTVKLNPRFVAWLMGLPPEWTSFEPLETESFRSKQRQLSVLLRDVLG